MKYLHIQHTDSLLHVEQQHQVVHQRIKHCKRTQEPISTVLNTFINSQTNCNGHNKALES